MRYEVGLSACLFLFWLSLQNRQDAQLSPRDPRDTLYWLKYWPTVVRITQTDHVKA